MSLPKLEIPIPLHFLVEFLRWLADTLERTYIAPARPAPFTLTIERFPIMATFRATAHLITPDRPAPPGDVVSQSMSVIVNGTETPPQAVPLAAVDFVFATALNPGDTGTASLTYTNATGATSDPQVVAWTVPAAPPPPPPPPPPGQPAPFAVSFDPE